ncbi:putative flagellin with Flp1-like domain [Paenibacillus taihuensis]|uniref:Putative flagellin with Flp1-like domain n=1 Tax=Paenibacillus taihuensis TaxID=1156355 RepID=A0A3D9QUA9_9BACL|nr:Flp1 family type IVb pilin [Paenibacillus taihuensis]REE67267.1 putative flagellin with Flp1-like domain [Paenibacillus taihuensis]
MNKMGQAMERFWEEDEGIGTLEIVLIIAVIIILALLFKDWIIALLQKLMGDADDKANEIFN